MAEGAARALVAVVMGSSSDLRVMQAASDRLAALGVTHEIDIVSAHRTPDKLYAFAHGLQDRGIVAVIAGAGGAAHLPGMIAALTLVPVIGVPISATVLAGVDALLSVVQMPTGIPVATVAIDNAENAALLAAQIAQLVAPDVRKRLAADRHGRRAKVLASSAAVLRVVGPTPAS